jgi:putative NADH-flavin reductase
MNIVIFGANGPTGRLLTRQALAAGHMVRAFTRHPQAFPFQDPRLQVLSGDVFDSSTVDSAIVGQDAVLSALGGPFSRKPSTVQSQGTANIMDAMRRHGVRRLVCVSSSAISGWDDPEEGLLFRKVLQPFVVGVVGRGTYADQRQMEAMVVNSGLDWTIVRPSGLFTTPAVTEYRVAEGHISGRFTSRVDLADFLLRQATDDTYLQKIAAVATASGQPNFLKFLWTEGIRKKK